MIVEQTKFLRLRARLSSFCQRLIVSLHLRNPHSALAALENRPGDVVEIRLRGERAEDAWRGVVDLAREHQIRVRTNVARETRKRGRGHAGTERTGAAEAVVKEPSPVSLEELFTQASSGEEAGLWVGLDCLQDPQNVGSIFRSAAFFGVQGIVMTRDRSAPMNATVCDVAAGGVETTPFAIETNLARSLDVAKKSGLWLLGTSEHAEENVFTIERDRPWLVIFGNEQKGLRRLTKDRVDVMCRLQPLGRTTSLNVSVAAGATLAALSRSE